MEVEAERAGEAAAQVGEAPDAGRHARKRAQPKRWADHPLATANLGGSSKRARALQAGGASMAAAARASSEGLAALRPRSACEAK